MIQERKALPPAQVYSGEETGNVIQSAARSPFGHEERGDDGQKEN
jgi:hypothetical protein